MRVRAPALAWCLLSLTAVALSADEAPKGPAIRLSFSVPAARPLLCVRTSRLDGEATVTAGRVESRRRLSAVDEVQFIDDHSVLEKDREEALRVFVSASSTINGEVADPPLAGVELAYDRQGQETSVKVRNDRVLPQFMLEDQVRAFSSLGIWLQLPEEARVGESVEVDLLPVGAVLLSGDLPVEKASARMKLLSFNEESGVAVLKGKAECVERGVHAGGVQASATYDLEGEIWVLPREQRIVSMAWRGKYTYEGTKGFRMTSAGDCQLSLRTEIGEAVLKAKGQELKFRDRKFEASQFGVEVTLPAYYALIPLEENRVRLVRTLEREKGIAVVAFEAVVGDTSKPAQFYEAVAANIRKNDKKAKTMKILSGIGNGFAILTSDKGEDGQLLTVRSELYPLGNRYLIYKLVAAPEHFPLAEQDFRRARVTLRTPKSAAQAKTASAGEKNAAKKGDKKTEKKGKKTPEKKTEKKPEKKSEKGEAKPASETR